VTTGGASAERSETNGLIFNLYAFGGGAGGYAMYVFSPTHGHSK